MLLRFEGKNIGFGKNNCGDKNIRLGKEEISEAARRFL